MGIVIQPVDNRCGAARLSKALHKPHRLIEFPELASNEFGDDLNNAGTFYYARRKSGTREKVNWYRGAASKTSLPTTQDDGTTAPTQTTNYNTSDDPAADPDSAPTSNGEGSRHNYTAIGQVNMTYDDNRNVQADGTRQFRYNYKNQLRRVWRKSDGESLGEIAKYREDAFGRRVHVESKWELGRRVYFDTRFERVRSVKCLVCSRFTFEVN